MHLTSSHLDDLVAVRDQKLYLSSTGFELDGAPVDGIVRDRLDLLWMDDYLDADISGPDKPALVVLTDKGKQALARAEQEAKA